MIAAVLAAGKAQRFGSCKALALIDERPMIEHVVNAIPKHLEKVIVIGAYQDIMQNHCKKNNWDYIVNENFALGMSSSVQLAASYALSKNQDMLLTLGDLPFVNRKDYVKLLKAFDGSYPTFSSFNCNTGPPAVFAPKHLKHLSQLKNNISAKQLFAQCSVAIEIPNAVKDIDYCEQLKTNA